MKTYTKLLSGIFILALALTLQSCSKCKDVECQNSGTCKKGDCECTAPYFGTLCEYECKNGGTISGDACNCATGYEGTECETEEREKFIAIYSANATCNSGSNSYTATISKSTGSVTEVKMSGAWGIFSNTVKATIDGVNITIPNQEPDNDGITIEGSGSISANEKIVSLTYTITDQSPDNCSATWTKQ